MAKQLNPAWCNDVRSAILQNRPINYTSSFRPSVQFLIKELSDFRIPYKTFNLGCGVVKITTENVDTCPCCKKKL